MSMRAQFCTECGHVLSFEGCEGCNNKFHNLKIKIDFEQIKLPEDSIEVQTAAEIIRRFNHSPEMAHKIGTLLIKYASEDFQKAMEDIEG